MGLWHKGKILSLKGGRGERRRGIRGDPYVEKIEVGADIHGYTGVLVLCSSHRMCIFGISIVDKDSE